MEGPYSSASDGIGEGPGDVEATMTQRRKWTSEEDEKLKSAVQLYGPMNWRQIAKFVGTRNHFQCTQRWRKSLSPGLCKGVWSPEEDAQLVRLFYRGFKNWGEVAEHMDGRTPKQCRERWMHHLDPAINKGEWTKEEDELILQLHQGMGNRWSEIAHGVPGRSSDAIKNRVGRLLRAIRKGGPKFNPSHPGVSVKCRAREDYRLQPMVLKASLVAQSEGSAFSLEL